MYRRSTVIAIWSLLVAGAVYLFVFEPGKSGFFPICIFRFLTGFTCPGCGTTRALHQILHGHFLDGFHAQSAFLDRDSVYAVRVSSLQRDRAARWRAAAERAAGSIHLRNFLCRSFVLDLS